MPSDFVAQPTSGTVADLLARLVSSNQFRTFNAAVAYVTVGGVIALLERMPSEFDAMEKRWIVGVDWCRSEPRALDVLATTPRSSVRIHDGSVVATRSGCVPRLPFHPKGFVLSSQRKGAVLVGSANLSRNGITRGHEADLALIATSGTRDWATFTTARSWFSRLWRVADPWATVSSDYVTQFSASKHLRQPMPTDDDAVDPSLLGPHAFNSGDLAKMRACDCFWIEAGNLHHNRGRGVPGNQLMLRALSRVYFGYPPLDLPIDSAIGALTITYAGSEHTNRTLRYSNNSMDVLSLPVPGVGAPAAYDQETLHFERVALGKQVVFKLSIGTARDRARWIARSRALGALYSMRGGRQFGVY